MLELFSHKFAARLTEYKKCYCLESLTARKKDNARPSDSAYKKIMDSKKTDLKFCHQLIPFVLNSYPTIELNMEMFSHATLLVSILIQAF